MVAGSSSSFNGLTISDDGSNSYTQVKSVVDSTNGYTMWLWAAPVTATSRKITVAWTSPTTGYVQGMAAEFYNVSTSSCTNPDASWSYANTTASTTMNAGSSAQTPSTSGDLLLAFAYRTNSRAATSYTPGSQSNITWMLTPGTTQLADGMVSEWGVYNSTSSVNPTLTWAPGSEYISLAVAVQAASSGSPLQSGIQVASIEHVDVSGFAGNNPNPGMVTIQVANAGNTLVLTGTAEYQYDPAAISDSTAAAWHKAVQGDEGTNGGSAWIWYACNVSATSTRTLAMTMPNLGSQTANEPDFAGFVYDIVNGAVSCFDNSWSQTGNQSSGKTFTGPSNMTPAGANEMFISVVSVGQGQGQIAGTPGYFDSGLWFNSSGQNQCANIYGFPNIPDECNGAVHYLYPGTSAVTSQWTGNGFPGEWAAAAAAFKPAANQPAPPTGLKATVN